MNERADEPTRKQPTHQMTTLGNPKSYRQLMCEGQTAPGIFVLADRGHRLLKRAVLEGGTMRTLITAFLATAAILGSNGALAKPTLTFVCGVPVGNRLEAIGEKMQEDHDGFTDVNPVFVLDDQKPGMLLLVFPATKAARDLGMKTAAEEAFIVSNTNEKITAVQVGSAGADVVEMYSLYPARGLLFYTRHTGRVATSVTFYASCKVSRS